MLSIHKEYLRTYLLLEEKNCRLLKEPRKAYPLAMSFYAISLQPLITHLNGCSNAKQCWFANDATGVGLIEELKEWWDVLNDVGPTIGYLPNAKKCWLITKPDKKETEIKVLGVQL